MNRIDGRLADIAARGGKALIPYITAGDPHPDQTVDLMHALVRGGADLLELGVPFSDPMADGPVIQRACERALAAGTTLARIIQMVARFRLGDAQTPVVLMGYLNPIERMGLADFARRAAAAGVDGVLVVDLTVEEAAEVTSVFEGAGLDCIFLLSPTTGAARIAAIASIAKGYLYYVSLKGVTGSSRIDTQSVALKLAEIKGITQLPVAVGFGVRDAQTAAEVAGVADAVIVGSALVAEIEAHAHAPSGLAAVLTARVATLRQAIDRIAKSDKLTVG